MKVKVGDWQKTPMSIRQKMLELLAEYQKTMRELKQQKKPAGELAGFEESNLD